ncbi:MAG: relaxase/mobilization nuclease domain-containing protein [Bacteroidales bacterium]|jgi:hypothetical protein|nr:relaxase/mobilization nuclease domain-containing protein [Bacteroidales bacterium]
MIAKFDKKPFSSSALSFKVDYHTKKIEAGKGEFLYSSVVNSFSDFTDVAHQVAGLNERVKYPFHEVSLNLPKGESLDDDRFIEIAKDFMKKMKYDNTAYSIIRHTDKEHEHIHILFTTVDLEGKKVDRFNERRRSQQASRELEQKYTLKETVYNKFDKNTFSEIKAREYYFHNALVKGLKSYQYEVILNEKLDGTILSNIGDRSLTNSECEVILGTALYDEIGSILDMGNFFNKLFKDELLSIMDNSFLESKSFVSFKKLLADQGVYMRLVSDKGQSKYVYGLSNVPIYFNDTTLPKRYRYGEITSLKWNERLNVEVDQKEVGGSALLSTGTTNIELSADEQKHVIYNLVYLALHNSDNYEEFSSKLKYGNVFLEEHKNSKGVYGLSLTLSSVGNPVTFKASDVSKNLSYPAINRYFTSIENPISRVANDTGVIKSIAEDTNKYIPLFSQLALSLMLSGSDRYDRELEREEEDNQERDDLKKKKKKKNMNIHKN